MARSLEGIWDVMWQSGLSGPENGVQRKVRVEIILWVKNSRRSEGSIFWDLLAQIEWSFRVKCWERDSSTKVRYWECPTLPSRLCMRHSTVFALGLSSRLERA